MIDVGWGDLIDYLGDDPDTKSIVIYMESIGDARSFLSASREVALTKPIIVIKAGRTEAAAKAAASHTGSLSGSDDVLDAAFRRVGVLRVDSISQLFDMAEVLAKQPRPRGPKLAIVTNAGGPGVLAADALIENQGQLATLSSQSIEQLDAFLPAAWSHNNPIDILGDANPERYARTLAVTTQDPNIDGFLVILTPQAMTDPTATAPSCKPTQASPGSRCSPVGWEAPRSSPASKSSTARESQHSPYPDSAAQAFTFMWRSHYNLQALYETPSLATGADATPGARDRRRRDRRRRARAGPHRAHRGRVETDPGGLRNPDRRDEASPRPRTKPSRLPPPSGSRSSSSSFPTRSPTRPTWAAFSSTSLMPRQSATLFARSSTQSSSAPGPGISRA